MKIVGKLLLYVAARIVRKAVSKKYAALKMTKERELLEAILDVIHIDEIAD